MKYILLASSLALLAHSAHAGPLDSAFGSLGATANTSITEPGRVSTNVRGSVVFGGASVRFPQTQETLNVFSVTPPRFSSGCGGVDAHFGGFSYVSGEQLVKLIKQVGQAAPGVAVSILMNKLCPQCAEAIQQIVDKAQKAANLAFDSCALANGTLTALADGIPSSGTERADAVRGFCSQNAGAGGQSEDFLSAASSFCVDVAKQIETVKGAYEKGLKGKDGKPVPAADANAKAAADGLTPGNATWQALKFIYPGNSEAEIANRLLLLNMLEFTVVTEGLDQLEYPPSLATVGERKGGGADLRPVMTYFMCGNQNGKVPDTASLPVKTYCSNQVAAIAVAGTTAMDIASRPVWDCAGEGLARYAGGCERIESRMLSATVLAKKTGFLLEVDELLQEGVNRIRSNRALSEGPGDEKGQALLALLQTVPYPLYSVLNVAAVYPAAAGELLSTMAVNVAEELVYANLDAVLRTNMATQDMGLANVGQVRAVRDVMVALRSQASANQAQLGMRFELQRAMAESIRMLNQSIQRQVMSEEMLGAARYATTLNKSAEDASKGGL